MRKPFIAGNWKMFKTTGEAKAFAQELLSLYQASDVNVAVCAPFTQLAALKEAFAGTEIKVGAQNMHFEEEGAFTGEVSASMLEEIGTDYCIIGHSERRRYFGETDETVNKKLHTAYRHGIQPIFCVGESLEERDGGRAEEVVRNQITAGLAGFSPEQLSRLVIAYEPIWAIGTGRTATPKQANEMCGTIRSAVEKLYGSEISEETVIQYGGSVKPDNASELMEMEEIDGALVGGASLKASEFIQIINF